MRKEVILLGEIASKEMSTVKGRWTNLMFTQRNNPYCDLLKISYANIYFFINSSKLFLIFFIYLPKITRYTNEENNRTRFRYNKYWLGRSQ